MLTETYIHVYEQTDVLTAMHTCILTDKQRLHRREREIKQVSNLVFYALSAITVNSGRCERERETEGGVFTRAME